MKKILFLLFIGIGIAATSCKKETIIGPNNTKTIIKQVASSQWALTGDKVSYFVDLPAGDIDDYLQHNGAVLVYISYDNGTTYEQVPETYGGVAFSFSHQAGSVELVAQVYDGGTPTLTQPPAPMTVKIVLIDSNP
jgi:hypothetical protein